MCHENRTQGQLLQDDFTEMFNKPTQAHEDQVHFWVHFFLIICCSIKLFGYLKDCGRLPFWSLHEQRKSDKSKNSHQILLMFDGENGL